MAQPHSGDRLAIRQATQGQAEKQAAYLFETDNYLRMMKERIQQLLYRRVLTIHWHEGNDGVTIHSLICQRSGGTLLVEKRLTGHTSLASLADELDNHLPIILTITGKGVLQYQATTSATSWPELLRQRLPGADPQVFTGQSMVQSTHLSIIRKDRLQQILAEFATTGLMVTAYYIGPTAIEALLPLLQYEETIYPDPYQVAVEGEQIQSIQEQAENKSGQTSIGNDQYYNNEVLAFSAAIAEMIRYQPQQYHPPVLTGRKAYELGLKTRWLGFVGLTVIFLALLVNFLVYSHSSRKLSQVEGELYYSQSLLLQLDSLESQVQQRRAALGDRPYRQSQLSKIGDDLAATIPQGIQLRKLQLFPVERASPNNRSGEIGYRNNEILIQAQTREGQLINRWIKQLESLAWVKEVKLQPFSQTQNDINTFELLILRKG